MTDTEIITALSELKIQISTYRAEVTAQNCVTNAALQGVNTRLDKINGSVARHEEIINKRAIVVKDFEDFKEDYKDIPDKIRHLEDQQLSSASIKKFVGAAIGITATVVSIVFTVLNYFMKAA